MKRKRSINQRPFWTVDHKKIQHDSIAEVISSTYIFKGVLQIYEKKRIYKPTPFLDSRSFSYRLNRKLTEEMPASLLVPLTFKTLHMLHIGQGK